MKSHKYSLILIIVSLLIAQLAGPVFAQEIDPDILERITEKQTISLPGNQREPRVHGRYIVYLQEVDEGRHDVHVYDSGATTNTADDVGVIPITTDGAEKVDDAFVHDYFHPMIHGQYIVWLDREEMTAKVYLYDMGEDRVLGSADDQGIRFILLRSASFYRVKNCDLYDGLLACEVARFGPPENSDVTAYHIDNKWAFPVSNDTHLTDPNGVSTPQNETSPTVYKDRIYFLASVLVPTFNPDGSVSFGRGTGVLKFNRQGGSITTSSSPPYPRETEECKNVELSGMEDRIASLYFVRQCETYWEARPLVANDPDIRRDGPLYSPMHSPLGLHFIEEDANGGLKLSNGETVATNHLHTDATRLVYTIPGSQETGIDIRVVNFIEKEMPLRHFGGKKHLGGNRFSQSWSTDDGCVERANGNGFDCFSTIYYDYFSIGDNGVEPEEGDSIKVYTRTNVRTRTGSATNGGDDIILGITEHDPETRVERAFVNVLNGDKTIAFDIDQPLQVSPESPDPNQSTFFNATGLNITPNGEGGVFLSWQTLLPPQPPDFRKNTEIHLNVLEKDAQDQWQLRLDEPLKFERDLTLLEWAHSATPNEEGGMILAWTGFDATYETRVLFLDQNGEIIEKLGSTDPLVYDLNVLAGIAQADHTGGAVFHWINSRGDWLNRIDAEGRLMYDDPIPRPDGSVVPDKANFGVWVSGIYYQEPREQRLRTFRKAVINYLDEEGFWEFPEHLHIGHYSPSIISTGDGNLYAFVNVASGIYLRIIDHDGNVKVFTTEKTFFNGESGPDIDPSIPFIRGEVNGDGWIDIADPITILTYLFIEDSPWAPHCLDAVDVNDDGLITRSDAEDLLKYLFLGTFTVPAPGVGPEPGEDPTADDLTCLDFP